MEADITKKKESYIDHACRIALGESNVLGENDGDRSIRFWQGLTAADRMSAATEIVRRVHLARGGNPNHLKMDRSNARLRLLADKNKD